MHSPIRPAFHATASLTRARRGLFSLAVGAILVSLAACNRKQPLPPYQGDADFVIAQSGHNLGNIEPCSCNNRTVGGFPRRFTAMEKVRADVEHVVMVDSGNALFSEDRRYADKTFHEQMKLKARAIAEAFVRTKLDAMVFGEMDLYAGGDFFLDVVEKTKLPIVAANVYDRETGKPMFERYKIFDCGGLKVAVFGLVAQELHPTVSEPNEEGNMMVTTNNKMTVILEDRFERRNVKIEDPVKTAQDLVPELRTMAHLVLCLAHLPPKTTQDLPSQVPGINFIVGRHVPANRPTYTLDDSTATMSLASSMNGTSFGVAEIHIRGGDLSIHDYSGIANARTTIDGILAILAEIKDKFGTDDPQSLATVDEEAAARATKLKRNLAWYENQIATSDPKKQSHFRHYSVQLDGKEQKDDPAMLEFVRSYRQSLKALYDPANTERAKAIEVVDGSPHFIGADACAMCHRPQTEFWRGTKHGQAWKTMLDYQVEYDLECITCHTVGFMLPAGFDRPDRVAGFEDVQCENCHGPGSYHVTNPLAPGKLITDPSVMTCERCHNHEHSPSFKRVTYLPRASCPPIDPWEPLIRGAFGKIRTDFERRMEAKGDSVPPDAFAGLVDVYLRLERWDDAIATAERGMTLHPRIKKGMLLGIARALDAKGDTRAALERLETAYREDEYKTDPRINALLCELLIRGHDPSARNLDVAEQIARYAIDHFDQDDGAFREFRADIEHDRGNLDSAIELIEGLLKGSSGKARHLNEKRDAWRNERETRLENAVPPPIDLPPP